MVSCALEASQLGCTLESLGELKNEISMPRAHPRPIKYKSLGVASALCTTTREILTSGQIGEVLLWVLAMQNVAC